VSDRATALADALQRVNGEVIDFVSGCSDAEWSRVVQPEGWTVGVVAHHVAEGHMKALRWMEAILAGEGVGDTPEADQAEDAAHAEAYADVTRADTLAHLRTTLDGLAAFVRTLDDDALVRTAPFGPEGGRPRSVEQLGATTHADRHLAQMRAAVGRPAGAP
jgi:uncharacterized damage-inducible protein DinB